jgi:hypothetical protein
METLKAGGGTVLTRTEDRLSRGSRCMTLSRGSMMMGGRKPIAAHPCHNQGRAEGWAGLDCALWQGVVDYL